MKEKKKAKRKIKDTPLCPDCGNPTLDITKVGIWELARCTACEFFDRKQADE